jgi:hypothetical protein
MFDVQSLLSPPLIVASLSFSIYAMDGGAGKRLQQLPIMPFISYR